jgi:hypothetical protein
MTKIYAYLTTQVYDLLIEDISPSFGAAGQRAGDRLMLVLCGLVIFCAGWSGGYLARMICNNYSLLFVRRFNKQYWHQTVFVYEGI